MTGWRNAVVKTGDTLDVTGQRHVKVDGPLYTDVTDNIESISKAAHLFTSKRAEFDEKQKFHVKVGGCELMMALGP